MRTAWFYRHFGKNIDPSKIDRVRLCDYGDHSRMSFCSPAEDEENPLDNPNLPTGKNPTNNTMKKEIRSSFTSIPMRCLDDPDLKGCEEFRTLQKMNQ